MATITFKLDDRIVARTKPIQVRIRHKGKLKQFNTNIRLKSDEWVDGKSTDQILNSKLDDIKDLFDRYWSTSQNIEDVTAKIRMKCKSLVREQPLQKERNLIELFDDFLKDFSIDSVNTFRNYQTTRNHLVNFLEDDASIEQVDTEFLIDFAQYMSKLSISNNSIQKVYMAKFISFLEYYMSQKHIPEFDALNGLVYNKKVALQNFKSVKTEIHGLTLDEIKELVNFDFSYRVFGGFFKTDHRIALAQYLFSSFTGIRPASMLNLTHDSLISRGNKRVWRYIESKNQKSREIAIPKVVWDLISDFHGTYNVCVSLEESFNIKEIALPDHAQKGKNGIVYSDLVFPVMTTHQINYFINTVMEEYAHRQMKKAYPDITRRTLNKFEPVGLYEDIFLEKKLGKKLIQEKKKRYEAITAKSCRKNTVTILKKMDLDQRATYMAHTSKVQQENYIYQNKAELSSKAESLINELF